MERTPTSLKVLGILGIIYASFIFLTLIWSGVQLGMGGGGALQQQMQSNTMLWIWQMAALVVSLGLGSLLMASSIGCLKCRRWARMGMNTYAIGHTVVSIANMVMSILFVMPIVMAQLAAAPGGGAVPGYIRVVMIISIAIGMLFNFGIALTILIIVNRKIAVDAFNGIFPATATNFPVDGFPPTV